MSTTNKIVTFRTDAETKRNLRVLLAKRGISVEQLLRPLLLAELDRAVAAGEIAQYRLPVPVG